MRLIDADALMADLEKWLKQIDPTHPPEDNAIPPMEDIIVSTLMTIEEQPTIEPQRMRGRWETIEGWDGDEVYRCSECGEEFVLIDGTPKENGYHFCPNCGADMREGQDENDRR